MKYTSVAKITLVMILGLLAWSFAAAQEKAPDQNALQIPDRLFDMKVPDGFKSEAVDEPGILKWRKDSGEIYVIVGDLFGESGDSLFKMLKSSAEKNKTVQETKALKIKGGKAVLYKEKAPEDSTRLVGWHLLVVTNKKIISLDFSAPAGEFNSFVPAFESAINSFKLKNAS